MGRISDESIPSNQQKTGSRNSDLVQNGSEAAATQPRIGMLFRGTVADAKVEMDIKRDGEALTGSYFYLKSGSSNRLNLEGKISSNGSFTIQETDAAGKSTGQFQGKWKDDPNESGAVLEGEWLRPGQKADGKAFYAWEQMLYFSSTSLATREIKESVKAKKATLNAEYPELSGGANDEKFNKIVKERIVRSLADFKKDLSSMSADDVKMMGEMGAYIDVGYDVEYADDNMISVNFGEDTFLGGAHPNHGTFTLTYDLNQGREVKLADLFKPGSKYLATIAEYSMRDLKSRKALNPARILALHQTFSKTEQNPRPKTTRTGT